jgi:hypothetical protein
MQPKLEEKILSFEYKIGVRRPRLWQGLGDMSPSANNNFVVLHFWDDFIG